MPKFQGFSGQEVDRMRKIIAVSKHCINKALDEAFADNRGFMRRAHKYFDLKNVRGGHEAGTSLIMKTVSSMRLMIDADSYHVVKGGEMGNTHADMRTLIGIHRGNFGSNRQENAKQALLQGTLTYAGRPVNAYEARLIKFEQSGSSPMNFYAGFFKLTSHLNDQQSQVEVFLHELSHGAAGTEDVDQPSCYGWSGVQYCKQNGSSTMNAENYGFFLQSYLFA